MGTMKAMAFTMLALVALIALPWLFTGNDFFLYRAFAPEYEQARRDTFKQSQAYNDGMVQELQSMRLDYAKGNADQKTAIRSVILHRAAAYPCESMPADLCQFVTSLKNERNYQ